MSSRGATSKPISGGVRRPAGLSTLAVETSGAVPHEAGAKSSGGKARSSGSGKRSGRKNKSPYAREQRVPTPTEALRAELSENLNLAGSSSTPVEDGRPVSSRTRSRWRLAADQVRGSGSILDQWKAQSSKKAFETGDVVLDKWRGSELPRGGKSILDQWAKPH